MVTLTVLPLRVTFRAQRDIFVANPHTAVRGAFGLALRSTVCERGCQNSQTCPQGVGQCFNARFFDGALTPAEQAAAPSGFRQDPPKPFVLRPGIGPGTTLRGAHWHLDIYCFHPSGLAMEKLLASLARLGDDGLGEQRAPSTIVRIEGLDSQFQPQQPLQSHVLPLPTPKSSTAEPVIFQFHSPTEIVHAGRIVPRPEFPYFIQALGNRLQPLCRFYGQGYWPTGELSAFRSHSAGATMRIIVSASPKSSRTSTRTGQRHDLKGFTGLVEYVAAWRSYSHWLQAGLWTGVGKHTQFGHGNYSFQPGSTNDLLL